MKQKNTPAKIRCPYCGRSAVLRKASYVYKEKALDEYLYVCAGYPECDAYVGVHAGTMRPKGTLANGDLRHKRIETHRLFDAIWKYGILSRKDAYRWMQDIFCLPSLEAHIGQFSDYRCDRLKDECRRVLQNKEYQLKQNLARNLRYLREGRKPYLSQQMLATKLEVTQKSISRYENGISLPPAHVLVAMADLFGLTTDALFMEKLPENKNQKEGKTTNENITYGNPPQDC